MTFYQLWFKVQDQRTALPIVLDGHNLIAQAQSGAGKTELLLVLGC
jgi:superfamily II DNA/RNA helicase